MTDYAYGISIPYALAHGVPWRTELQAILLAWRDCGCRGEIHGKLAGHLFIVPYPDIDTDTPCLWRTLPPDAWFESQERMAVDAPVPATACHPDDLRWLRSLTGLNQAEFAEAMGSTQAMISRKENGVDLVTTKFYDRVLQTVLDNARCGAGALTPERMDVLYWLTGRAHDGLTEGDSLT